LPPIVLAAEDLTSVVLPRAMSYRRRSKQSSASHRRKAALVTPKPKSVTTTAETRSRRCWSRLPPG